MHMVNVTPIVGLPQFSGWAQVYTHTFSPGLECVVTVSITGPQAGATGKIFLDQVTATPPHSAEELYTTIETAEQEVRDRQCQLSCVVIFFTKTQSTLIAYNATVLLKRAEKLGKIILPHKEISQVEGVLKTHDTFIAITATGQQYIETIEQQFSAGFDIDGVVTTLVPTVHAAPDTATVALGFMEVPEESKRVATYNSSEQEDADPEEAQTVGDPSELEHTTEPSSTPPPIAMQQRVKERSIPVPPLDAPPEAPAGPTVAERVRTAQQRITTGVTSLTKRLGSILHTVRAASSGAPRVQPLFSLKQKRILLGVSIAVVLLIAVVGGVLLKNRIEQQAAQAAVAPYQQRLEALQQTPDGEVLTARAEVDTLLAEVQEAELAAQEYSAAEQAAFAALVSSIQQLQTEFSGKEDVAELPIFYDIRLAVPDALTSIAALRGETAVFVDTGKATAVIVNTETKQATTVENELFSSARSIAGRADGTFVLLANGLQQLDPTDPEELTLLKEEGDSNRDAGLVGSFATYLYVLNADKRNLYRYAEQDAGYSDPIGWLRDPLGVPYESVISLAIDGEVWIGTNTGEIKRFASGGAEAFEISGLEEPFSQELHLYTLDDFANVYVLEPDAARIVILSKEGQFLRQIESASLAAATELLISDDEQTAFVISGSLIYEIQL